MKWPMAFAEAWTTVPTSTIKQPTKMPTRRPYPSESKPQKGNAAI